MKLRVGLVGLGDEWESRHRPALRALSDRFDVQAVCAQVALRAQMAADEFRAAAVDGFRAMIGRPDIDAIIVLAPNWYGPLPILAACDAGKAVYCAVALDMDLKQAAEVRRRVNQSGIAFMAELPRRHAPATQRLKELIATRLGAPRMLFCHRRRGIEPDSGHHGSKKKIVGNVSRDLIELVDWCHYVVGKPAHAVTGITYGDTAETGHYRMMSLEFGPPNTSGPIAQISSGRYLPASWTEAVGFRPPAALQVVCEHGVAFVDLPTSVVWFDDAGRHMESLDFERPVGEQLLMLFHRSITSLVRRTNDLEDAYLAVRVVLDANRSAKEGRRIELDL